MNDKKQHENIMADLKNKLREILNYIPTDKPIAYLDIPVYGNVGDLLINLGTELFLAENNRKVSLRLSVLDYRQFCHHITPEHFLIFQGGGNLGDFWGGCENLRQDIMRLFPTNHMIVLPQTVFFENPDNIEKISAAYQQRSNCMIFVRDKPSFEIVRQKMQVPCQMMPDMAHYLWQSDTIIPCYSGVGTLCLARTDKEAMASRSFTGKDWRVIIGGKNLFILNNIWVRLVRRNPAFFIQPTLFKYWYVFRKKLIQRALNYFKSYSSVHTDRLHGVIFSLLLGKDVVFTDNTYGKLSSYQQAWLSDLVKEIK